MSFGSRLQERRKELGITQVQLADILKVTKGAIGNYESELSSPKAEILYKLFDVLQCDANFLFQDEMSCAIEMSKSPTLAPANIGDERLVSIVTQYHSMNDEGKDRLLEQAQMLSEQSRFKLEQQKTPSAPQEQRAVNIQEALERKLAQQSLRGSAAAFGGQSISVDLTDEKDDLLAKIIKERAKK